jgi:hypothetical protein
MLLVILVVFIFPQSWRDADRSRRSVSPLGAFAGLFVLDTRPIRRPCSAWCWRSIVVDDAIVVLENVERIMREEGATSAKPRSRRCTVTGDRRDLDAIWPYRADRISRRVRGCTASSPPRYRSRSSSLTRRADADARAERAISSTTPPCADSLRSSTAFSPA